MGRQLPPEADSVASLVDLVDESVAEILRHEDAGRYLDWMRANAVRLMGAFAEQDKANLARAAVTIGRSIWNAVPLPGNHFKPRPLPEPGRNDPCPCGSGRKYKHCCAGLPAFAGIQTEDIWPVLVSHLLPAQLDAALAARRIPPSALAAVAGEYIEDGHVQKAVQLLEPVFASGIERLDERFEPAFDVLSDAYLRLGHDRKRTQFAERVAGQAHGALQRAAWQRLAAIRHDAGAVDGAWEAMRRARQADPGDPTLVLNEITLLLSEGRTDEARARAEFWAAKLSRERYPDEDLIATLRAAERDPEVMVTDMFLSSRGADLPSLRGWIARAVQRPLPRYEPRRPPVIDASDPAALRKMLREHFSATGVLPEQIDALVEQASRDLVKEHKRMQRKQAKAAPARQSPLFAESAQEAPAEADGAVRELQAPAALKALEGEWHRVFPCGKPSLTERSVADAQAAWDSDTQGDWMAFLQRRPEAADSLDVLDDVAGALLHLEWQLPQGPGRGLAARLVERARAMVESVAGHASGITLPWGIPVNRPALRALARDIDLCLSRDEHDRATQTIELVLRLNPTDNHGFRAILITEQLRKGDEAGAAALLEQYPEDGMLDMMCGAALVAFLRKDMPAATRALAAMMERNAYVAEYLWRTNARPPRRSSHFGLRYGSREEAWDYREHARDVWEATPGALDWLKRAERQTAKEARAPSPVRKAARPPRRP
jgi:hypothetical protein